MPECQMKVEIFSEFNTGGALSSVDPGRAGGLGLAVTSKAAYLSVSNLHWQPVAQLQCAGKRELA
jgi:hypothetical protein